MGDVFLKVSQSFPKSLANFEKIKKIIRKMDDAILVEGSAANDEPVTEAIETNIKTDNEELKSSEVVDSTKNGSTEPNLKNEVSTGIFLTKLESSEEPTSVVDSNKTESNTEAGICPKDINWDKPQPIIGSLKKVLRKFKPYKNKLR